MRYIFLWLILLGYAVQAQQISGFVIEEVAGKRYALIGATVKLKNSAAGAVTDDNGKFTLTIPENSSDTLMTTALGYAADTTALKGAKQITITLQPVTLGTVEVSIKRKELSAARVETITEADLVKDACCNLSESFENSATVDVSYSDAVSGAKEIRMLGLDGVYTQLMVENMPSIRTLGNTFGLVYVPGPWMSSIQVNKGAASVVNGYEGITGQINAEFKKPMNADKLFINFFLNQDVRSELNVMGAKKISERWSYFGAAHGFYNWLKMDMNHDHYIDNPLVKNFNALNRVHYTMKNGGMFMLAAVVNIEDRRGGSMHYNPKLQNTAQADFGLRLQTQRAEIFAKTGVPVSEHNYVGIQYKYMFHRQYGFTGRRDYDALAHYGYFNAIFQHELKEGDLLKTGISFQTDFVSERFDTFFLKRTEIVPGVFTEGTFNFGRDDKVTLIAGGRVDYHNLFGVLLSPRINIRWNILYDLSFRASGGRGYRVATVFAENYGWLANNRSIAIANKLGMEEAWNYGASLTYNFNLNFRDGSISVDYFRTDFIRQVVPDIEQAGQLQFYNLQNGSNANAVQIDLAYEPVKRFDVKLSYKYERNVVKYNSGKKIYPFRPQHRGLVSLQYTTKNEHWRFNTSINWFGKTRVPNYWITGDAPVPQGKNWVQWNAQITFAIKNWEVYLGGENLLNFIQKNPIVSADAPLSNQFDASMIWGPLRGAMAFTGFRWIFK
ncbi:MAG: carboxypeptidase-like regulatory domain-containing protein [Chitinophagales bacterium]|nr:carboxypeptidase-like regulatory domain-containing protein [Chitinophagales bacterium]